MSGELDYTFQAMGSEVRLLLEPPLLPGLPPPLAAADRERAFVWDFARRLSRFEADSELSALNRDPRRAVPASQLLRAAVAAGLWAARRSGGLVDPTLGGALEAAGYVTSMADQTPASLTEALRWAPPRRPAAPAANSPWTEMQVDDAAGLIVRSVGTKFDTGGTGKGLCADAVAHRLGGYGRFLVDCGGDIAVGGLGAQLRPFLIGVEHPLTGDRVGSVAVRAGGIASSGLNVRIWRDRAGGYSHHLLDPRTGRSAWTGLVGATAVSPESALEAETLSKMALLSGPEGARRVLVKHGGVIFHDDGEVEIVGPLECHGAEHTPAAALAA
ncbi:MAG: FAD:protein FMN transferase [Solirubrobacteraceae bacterium]